MVEGTVLLEAVSCSNASPQLQALLSIFGDDPHSEACYNQYLRGRNKMPTLRTQKEKHLVKLYNRQLTETKQVVYNEYLDGS